MSDSSSRPGSRHRGLEPKWYLDPAIFEWEIRNLFANAWCLAGYASQLESAGSYFRTRIHEREGVIIRDANDEIRGLENVCRHRGTQLCSAQAGQLKSAFACPYHGWKYDFEGKLISAPHMQSVPGFDSDDYGLGNFEIRNWHGLIFAKTPGAEEDFAVSRLEPFAQRYQLSKFKICESIRYDLAANWKLFFQNFNECYHCPSVHPQLTPYSDYRDAENDFEKGPVLGGPMKIRATAESITVNGAVCGAVAKSLPESEHRLARYYTIFPNLFISMFPDYVMIHRLLPLALDRTQIVCDFLFHEETIQSEGFDPQAAAKFWDQTNQQDWEMCERVQLGISTPGFRPSPYSNLESLLVAFDQHYLESVAEDR